MKLPAAWEAKTQELDRLAWVKFVAVEAALVLLIVLLSWLAVARPLAAKSAAQRNKTGMTRDLIQSLLPASSQEAELMQAQAQQREADLRSNLELANQRQAALQHPVPYKDMPVLLEAIIYASRAAGDLELTSATMRKSEDDQMGMMVMMEGAPESFTDILLKAKGGWAAMIDFLAVLEEMGRPVYANNMEISYSEEDKALLMNMTLRVLTEAAVTDAVGPDEMVPQ